MSKAIERLEDLTPDAANPNQGTLRGVQVLDHSLERYGAGRSIVADRNGVVISGNHTLEQAVARGLGVKVVPSDGTKLVVVKRTDLDLAADPKARELAYVDNRAGELGLSWSPQQVEADLAAGLDLGTMFTQREREAMLESLDTRQRQAVLAFDTPAQRAQFLALVEIASARFTDEPSFGGRMARWAEAQLTAWDEEDSGAD